MTDEKKSLFDRAERLTRRALEKLGGRVDERLSGDAFETNSAAFISRLAERIEQHVESNLEQDPSGGQPIAPNLIRVRFSYEESANLNDASLKAIGAELAANLREFIANRRYRARGAVVVRAERDLFAKSLTISSAIDAKAAAEDEAPSRAPKESKEAAANESGTRRLLLEDAQGRGYWLTLQAGGAPAIIGRAAGLDLRLDDLSVTRLHCSLALRSDGTIVVADLESSNGTAVNGAFVPEGSVLPIRAGDSLTVGDVRLRVAEIR